MSDADLYMRTFRLRVDRVEISRAAPGEQSIDLDFEITKTLKREPNTAEFKLYNLSAKTRQQISGRDAVDVAFEAGYKGKNSLLYLGQTRGAVTHLEKPDTVSVLESGDSEKQHRTSRIRVPVGPSTPLPTALTMIASALKVKPGNVAQIGAKLAAKGLVVWHVDTTYVGLARQAIDDFARSAGLEWSVQDGALQLLDRGGALDSAPFILGGSESGGLVGSPNIDTKGTVTATTLLLPDLACGRRVVFYAKFVKGIFRISEINYSGSTYGGPWYANITCTKVANG